MPYLGSGATDTGNRLGFTPTPNDMAAGTNYVVTQDRNPLAVGAGVIGLGVVDLADTVASSIPGLSKAVGIQRGDVDRKFLSAVDSPGLSDFYHDYKGGIEATSGIMGTVASELIARRFTAPAGAFMGFLKSVPFVRRVAALDNEYDTAMMTLRAADVNLASRGAIGVEQYIGKTTIGLAEAMGNSAFGDSVIGVARNTAVRNVKALGFLKGAAHAAATEGVMAATLNTNEFLYSDSAAHNLMWMTAGVATGGLADTLHAAYSIRKFVNGDEVKRAFSGALDPVGYEADRLLWKKMGLEGDESSSFLAGSLTDRLTNLAVGAETLTTHDAKNVEGAAALYSNRSALATQQIKQSMEILQMVARKGTANDGATRFGFGSVGYWNHAEMLIKRDPAAMYGVESLGGVADDTTAHTLHEVHVKRLQERIDQTEEVLGSHLDDDGNLAADSNPAELAAAQRMIRRLEFETTLTPMVSVDGELMPMSESEAFAGFKEPKIGGIILSEPTLDSLGKPVKNADKHGLFAIESESHGAKTSVGTDFIHFIPNLGKGKGLDSADHYAIMNLYRTADKALDHMVRFNHAIPLPKKPDWFQLDMAEELMRRTDGRAKVVFPDGMTRDSARIEAMIQKADAIKKWDASEGKAALKADSKGQTYEGQLSKLRLRYNLPKLSAYERGILGPDAEHPVESLVRGIAQMPEDEIRKMNLRDMQETMGQFKRIGDVAPVMPHDIEDLGKSFKFMKDEAGNPIKPLLLYKRAFKTAEWTQEHTAERMAAAKMYSVERLTDANAAPVSRDIVQSVLAMPEFDAAARTDQLMDNQIQGIVGNAPQKQAGAIGNALRTRDWRDRDNLAMLSATRVRESVDRLVRDRMKSVVEGAFQGNLSLLANPRNAGSKLLLDQFHTFRPGWDLAEEPIQKADGMFGFWLRPTEDNAERFQQTFGRKMGDKGEMLRQPNGKEVVVDSIGLDLQNRFNQVTNAVQAEKNTILRANGRGEIDSLPWYVPPQNTDNKFIGFTFGPDGKPVRGMTVVADTIQEYNRARDLIYQQIEDKGLGYTFRSQEEIKDFASIWDKVQMEFVNPGVTPVQPGKAGTGRLVGQQIRTDAFSGSLKYLNDSFQRHGNDIIETLFKEQINSAKARSAISSEITKNNGRFEKPGDNINQFYLENLLGRSPGGTPGKVAQSIDKLLADATPGAHAVMEGVTRFLAPVTPWSRDPQAKKDFTALTEKLGKYMPFESAHDMIERQGLGAVPLTTKAITGKLNAFSAAVVLRMMEVVHPIMNLAGILNAAPAAIRSFTPRAGEAAEDFGARVGHLANIFDLGEGKQVGVLDMVKLTNKAFKKAWSREAHPEYDYMVKRGYLSQEVAEFHRQFGAIETPSAWDKFFHKSVDHMSTLSDKSEDFSRSWAHMAGLEMADHLGIQTMEGRHGFAHDVANKMIANYSPNNRPDIFKGPFGAPIGLFQSFVLNYYERMFRHVETKDYKALVTQLATQTGLFGVSSIPGWAQFNSLMSDSQGKGDADSAIYRRFGGNAGDFIAHGVLSNLPKMFGAPGVDLYSRGDVSIRQLQVQNMDSVSGILNSTVPAWNVAGKAATLVYDSLVGAARLFSGKNPHLSSTQLGEVLSNAMANRPISGMIEQALAHGNKTDAAGQLVTETHGVMETAYRLLGVRSMNQSEEIRAFYANKNAQTHQAALKEQLTQYTRTMMRDGDVTHLPEVFDTYMKNGGDPRFFRRWLKATYISATNTRAERQLQKALKNPASMDQALRLLDAGVSPTQDEEVGDTDKLYVSGDSPDPNDPAGAMNLSGQ